MSELMTLSQSIAEIGDTEWAVAKASTEPLELMAIKCA